MKKLDIERIKYIERLLLMKPSNAKHQEEIEARLFYEAKRALPILIKIAKKNIKDEEKKGL